MGHHQIRTDKTCLNCNYVVESKYCPNCGQENSETRQSFHYLFTHFFEDLTHYDGEFWKTIKFLLFRPGRLTIEYLAGRRKRFVPPVKLYIFISFVTFLLPSLLPEIKPDASEVKPESEESIINFKQEGSDELVRINDTIEVKTAEELDEVQKKLPEKDKLSFMEFSIRKILLNVNDKEKGQEFREKAGENFIHILPKALFIYMPLFAFLVWLMHDKKKWYYFDSGVFTLHYFSFLL
ncbi:MAG TPA: DUF3667 domain-containing protein, partial [Flavobacterium sp.]|nr:DUF3667 domain-containing protein [Flavobacterium sp.]